MAEFHILLVDDEPDIRDSIAMGMELLVEGVRVSTASDGQEAMEILRREPVHLIMSDYRMPLMDGLEFLKKAQQEFPRIPRVMLTAYPDPKLAAEAVRGAGVGLFVSKPFHQEYLVSLVKAIRER